MEFVASDDQLWWAALIHDYALVAYVAYLYTVGKYSKLIQGRHKEKKEFYCCVVSEDESTFLSIAKRPKLANTITASISLLRLVGPPRPRPNRLQQSDNQAVDELGARCYCEWHLYIHY